MDLLAIPGDQMGKREKMSRSTPLPGAPTVGVPTRGSGSQLVNVVCFLVPDVDARGNTVMHGFILVSATGVVCPARGCARALYYLCTGGACSRVYKRDERGREAPRCMLEEELIEACANIGGSVVLSVAFYRMNPTAPLKGSPPPPFIDTRRDGVHAQGIVQVVVFSPNRRGAVVEHCGKYTVGVWRRAWQSSWASSLVLRRSRRRPGGSSGWRGRCCGRYRPPSVAWRRSEGPAG